MSGAFRRCGCQRPDGRRYGALPGDRPSEEQKAKACPLMEDRKHGSWTFRLSAGFEPVTGRRRQINAASYGGPWKTKKEAETARAKALLDLNQGKLTEPSKELYRDYLARWIERRASIGTGKRGPLADATLDNYLRYIRRDLAPSRLGGMKIRDIRRRHVQAFIDELTAAGRGAVTIRRIVAVVQGSLASAVREELIHETPARLLELPAIDTDEFHPWEPEEVGHFLDVAAEHRLGALFEVAVFTGLRRAELVALKWSDVDLERRELQVRRDTTKTDAGRRRVAVDDRAVGALLSWQITQQAERDLFAMDYVGSGQVFTMEDGRPLKVQYPSRLFQQIRKRSGLSEMTFHGLRHQQASLQLAAGTPLAVVSKRLGHASVSVTGDIYSHLLESTEHAAANAAASLVPARKASAHQVHTQPLLTSKRPPPPHGENGL